MNHNSFRKLYNTIQWKFRQLKRCQIIGFSRTDRIRILWKTIDNSLEEYLEEHYSEKLKQYYLDRYSLKIPSMLNPIHLEEVLVDGIYSRFTNFVPKKNDIVLDIGAQYGDFTALCASYWQVEKVYAFEPMTENYNLAKQFFDLNSLDNVRIMNTAVGSQNGFAGIESGETMLRVLHLQEHGDTEVMTIDSMSLEKVHLIKIDVEGFELEVLRGAVNTIDRYHPKIIVEVHSVTLKHEVLKFMENVGYQLIHYDKPVLNPGVELDLTQNLFFN